MGKLVTLPSGESVPSMGLGTWHMGERIGNPKTEVDALVRGLDLGAKLIDTAEMYARGGAERVVGSAIRAVEKTGLLFQKSFLIMQVLMEP